MREIYVLDTSLSDTENTISDIRSRINIHQYRPVGATRRQKYHLVFLTTPRNVIVHQRRIITRHPLLDDTRYGEALRPRATIFLHQSWLETTPTMFACKHCFHVRIPYLVNSSNIRSASSIVFLNSLISILVSAIILSVTFFVSINPLSCLDALSEYKASISRVSKCC